MTAQREAGGDDRRSDDDGDHLMGAQFGDPGGQVNLTAQDRNLNRGDYKAMEKEWARLLSEGNKVYVNVESYNRDGWIGLRRSQAAILLSCLTGNVHIMSSSSMMRIAKRGMSLMLYLYRLMVSVI